MKNIIGFLLTIAAFCATSSKFHAEPEYQISKKLEGNFQEVYITQTSRHP